MVVGLYVPTVAFFFPGESIDIKTTKFHARRLVEAGVAGLVTHGSSGEAVHLDHQERQLINQATRDAIKEVGGTEISLIAGCGAQSTRETIQFCLEASQSGADYSLILPPVYYQGLLKIDHVIRHFIAVADKSPIPVLIYNFPGACNGLDLSSDTIITLADHPNIVGVKLTCGNTGKLARIVDTVSERRRLARQQAFRVFGGSVHFTIQTLAVGGDGIIGGTANLALRACKKLFELWEQENLAEARNLQAIVVGGDWVAIQGGFISVKAALQKYYGYGGPPRQPCTLFEGEELSKQLEGFSELMQLEQHLGEQL